MASFVDLCRECAQPMDVTDEQVDIALYHQWSSYSRFCVCGEFFSDPRSFVRHVLKAVRNE